MCIDLNFLQNPGNFGFNAHLFGARHINKGWDYQGFATFFWSSAKESDTKACAQGLNYVDPSVSSYAALKGNAFSVRCVKD